MATNTIWKFTVPFEDVAEVELPYYAEPLSVANQDERLVLYVLVGPNPTDNKNRVRRLRVAGTGHPIRSKDTKKFLGTCLFRDGSLVFHVFDLGWDK